MGELASMCVESRWIYKRRIISLTEHRLPTAAGQYHWVSQLAPPSTQKILSYIVGELISPERLSTALLTGAGWLTVTG